MDIISQQVHRIKNTFNQKHEPYVREHLAKVYTVVASAAGATSVGAVAQMRNIVNFGSFAAAASLMLVLALHFYRDNGKNYWSRFGMLMAFGFFSGQTLGPLLQYALYLNPNIVFTALLGTAVTFGSLSMAALFAERGKFLFLGGLLVISVNTMALVSLINIFLQIRFVQLVQLYVGVLILGAFVLFDTQSIIEKCRAGHRDAVEHAIDLFFDLLSMFRRILILLTQKEERKRNEKRNN